MNDPPPNPDDYNEGKAIYVNEPGFYSIVLVCWYSISVALGFPCTIF